MLRDRSEWRDDRAERSVSWQLCHRRRVRYSSLAARAPHHTAPQIRGRESQHRMPPARCAKRCQREEWQVHQRRWPALTTCAPAKGRGQSRCWDARSSRLCNCPPAALRRVESRYQEWQQARHQAPTWNSQRRAVGGHQVRGRCDSDLAAACWPGADRGTDRLPLPLQHPADPGRIALPVPGGRASLSWRRLGTMHAVSTARGSYRRQAGRPACKCFLRAGQAGADT